MSGHLIDKIYSKKFSTLSSEMYYLNYWEKSKVFYV